MHIYLFPEKTHGWSGDWVCRGQLKLIAIRRSLDLRVEFSTGEPHRLQVTRVTQGVTAPCPSREGCPFSACISVLGGWGREWSMKWHYVVWEIGELKRWLEVSISFA